MKKAIQRAKALERYVADKLGGKRNLRGADFSQSICDVDHPLFSIECKSRMNEFKKLYEYLDQAKKYDSNDEKLPLVAVRRKGKSALVIMDLEDFAAMYKFMLMLNKKLKGEKDAE